MAVEALEPFELHLLVDPRGRDLRPQLSRRFLSHRIQQITKDYGEVLLEDGIRRICGETHRNYCPANLRMPNKRAKCEINFEAA